MNLTVVFLALLAAALFGFNVHIQRRALDHTDTLTGAFLSVATLAGLAWLMAPILLEPAWLTHPATITFALGGLFFPVLGQILQVAALARVGPLIASAIGAFTPGFAIVPAVLLLGEDFGPQAALGSGLMITALLVAALSGGDPKRGWPLWALLLPLGAAAARGLVQPVTKAGLSEIPSPYYATLVMGTVSTVVLAGLLMLSGRGLPRRCERGHLAFVISGAVNGAGILALNSALERGQITLTAPLTTTAPLWTLAFGVLIFRNERVTKHLLGVAALVVAGAALLATR